MPFAKVAELSQELDQQTIKNTEELEAFRIKYLGTKNIIKPLFGAIKDVEPAQKKEYGLRVNELKTKATELYEKLKNEIAATQSGPDVRKIDPSLPGYPLDMGARHLVNKTIDEIVSVFRTIGFQIETNREIEDEWHNFTALNTPDNHPARDMTDTYYLKDNMERMLRSQTSTVQVHAMEQGTLPIRIISPGRVFRNETISARSHCQFHQIEGLYIDKNVSFADLKQTLIYYAQSIYGKDVVTRLRPSYFPFTEPSAEMDVYWGLNNEDDHRITKGTGWLEVMGCGMVDPQVLENCGIDPEQYSGFAFGMGVERQVMFKYKINDIRLFFENDKRFLSQFASII